MKKINFFLAILFLFTVSAYAQESYTELEKYAADKQTELKTLTNSPSDPAIFKEGMFYMVYPENPSEVIDSSYEVWLSTKYGRLIITEKKHEGHDLPGNTIITPTLSGAYINGIGVVNMRVYSNPNASPTDYMCLINDQAQKLEYFQLERSGILQKAFAYKDKVIIESLIPGNLIEDDKKLFVIASWTGDKFSFAFLEK